MTFYSDQSESRLTSDNDMFCVRITDRVSTYDCHLELSLVISADMHRNRFTCVSEHPGYPEDQNNTLSEMVAISVHYPPVSLTLTGNKHRNKTENKMDCHADGNPKPHYLFTVGIMDEKGNGAINILCFVLGTLVRIF